VSNIGDNRKEFLPVAYHPRKIARMNNPFPYDMLCRWWMFDIAVEKFP